MISDRDVLRKTLGSSVTISFFFRNKNKIRFVNNDLYHPYIPLKYFCKTTSCIEINIPDRNEKSITYN